MKTLCYSKAWLAFLAGLGLAVAALANACGGGGGGLSAEEYFRKLEAIANETQQQESAAQPSEEEAANLTLDEQKETGIELLNAFASITDDAAKKTDELNPPNDIQEEHDNLVAEAQNLAQTLSDFAAEAEDIPPEGVEEFFNSRVFVQSTFAAFDQACLALQQIADDEGVGVNLNCLPEEGG